MSNMKDIEQDVDKYFTNVNDNDKTGDNTRLGSSYQNVPIEDVNKIFVLLKQKNIILDVSFDISDAIGESFFGMVSSKFKIANIVDNVIHLKGNSSSFHFSFKNSRNIEMYYPTDNIIELSINWDCNGKNIPLQFNFKYK